jgi:glucokinase
MHPVLGIDLGGTTVNWVVRAGRAEDRAIVARGSVPTASDRTAIVTGLADIARRVETGHDVRAIGVGVPGHVNRSSGVVRFLPNLPGDWAGYPLGSELTRETGKPVHLLNDARTFCLAELTLGAAYGRSDALFLTLGTGVGGGVVVNGRLLVGPDDRLGEIGHLTYQREGRPCGCGNRGCLETYASGPALVTAAEVLGGRRPASAADVFAAAESGDEASRTVVERAGQAIGETGREPVRRPARRPTRDRRRRCSGATATAAAHRTRPRPAQIVRRGDRRRPGPAGNHGRCHWGRVGCREPERHGERGRERR